MSPKQLLSIALLFVCGSLFSQNYLKVNQNPNAPTGDHVYSDLQACIDAASNGDIIQIIPSNADYGNVIVDKELHFKGAGYVSDNQSGMTSKIVSMVLEPPFANGTTINAIVFTKTNGHPLTFGKANAPTDTLSNIEIYNCKVPGTIQLANCYIKNMTIRNNIASGLSYIGYPSLFFQLGDGQTEDLLIANNIIVTNYGSGYHYTALSVANETLITNNLFYSQNGFQAFKHLRNCTVTNNVFYGSSAASTANGSSYGNVFNNNLSSECSSYGGCDIPPTSSATPNNTGSDNLSDTNPYFENLVDNWWWSITYDLTLLEDSPLADAGSDGTDIGISGGPYPFTNYLHLRDLPYIHQMNVTGLILENQDIQVNAEARTNQQ